MDDWRVLELKFVFLCGKRIKRVYNVEEHILKLRGFLFFSCHAASSPENNQKRKNFPLKYLFHSKNLSGENNCDWEKQFHPVWNPYIDLSTICIASYSSDIYICLCMIGKNLEACDWPMVLLLNSQPGHNWWELSVYYVVYYVGGKNQESSSSNWISTRAPETFHLPIQRFVFEAPGGLPWTICISMTQFLYFATIWQIC